MSKKLAAKAGLIMSLPRTSDAVTRPDVDLLRPKTAPGSMLQFMSTQSAAIKEADELREQLREFEGTSPVRLLDAREVRPSKWANRHQSSFESADFAQLMIDMEAAGGNVQPIRVRPLAAVLNGSTLEIGATPEVRYEVVYGHRRHRACLELGIPVRALIEDATDQELFEAMEQENRGRKNLSAWEQGCMYRKALDEGLYPSLRKLAEAVHVDVSMVSKSLALARLPQAVIEAFPSPIDIQFRWAQPLGEALQKDPEAMMERARQLKVADENLAAVQVFDALINLKSKVLNRSTPEIQELGKGAKSSATMTTDTKGGLQLKFAPGVVPETRRKELIKLIEAFLKG